MAATKVFTKDSKFEIRQTGEDRTLHFLASDGSIDRHQEILDPSGWELSNFRKNPTMLWGHTYSSPPIARVVWIEPTKRGLEFKAKFPSEAEYDFGNLIYRLFKGQYLNAVSVGFLPKAWRDLDPQRDPKGVRRVYTQQELLEISAVAVPSNPAALQLAVQQRDISTKELSDMDALVRTYEADRLVREAERICREAKRHGSSEFERPTSYGGIVVTHWGKR